MSLLKLLEKKLTSDQLKEVQDALGDDFDYDMVPRSRLNKVIKQRNDLRNQITNNHADDDEGEGDDDDADDMDEGAGGSQGSEGLVQQKELRKLKRQLEKEKNDGINAVKIQYAALDKLRESKALDTDLVYGLLDKSKLVFGEDGKLTGIDDQIKDLQKNKAFLFGKDDDGVPGGTGRHGGSGDEGKDGVDERISNVFANYGVTPTE